MLLSFLARLMWMFEYGACFCKNVFWFPLNFQNLDESEIPNTPPYQFMPGQSPASFGLNSPMTFLLNPDPELGNGVVHRGPSRTGPCCSSEPPEHRCEGGQELPGKLAHLAHKYS